MRSPRVFAVTAACAGCGACLKTCPEKAIRPTPKGYPSPLVILEDCCTGCAECAEVCPVAACVEVLLEEE
ncbi:MAG: 4Fe-4S dicluster domain-containing protein [Actinomycetota bacterium]|nr:4Fe-4S dicluster domain-containing protein [Actinomycetota bacterium]